MLLTIEFSDPRKKDDKVRFNIDIQDSVQQEIIKKLFDLFCNENSMTICPIKLTLKDKSEIKNKQLFISTIPTKIEKSLKINLKSKNIKNPNVKIEYEKIEVFPVSYWKGVFLKLYDKLYRK